MHRDITSLARTPESTIRIETAHPRPARAGVRGVDRPRPDGRLVRTLRRLRPDHRRGRSAGRGTYRIGMLLPGRTDRRFVSGQYCRVDAPRTLSFTWAWEPHKAGTRETQVTVEFHPEGRRHRPRADPRALPRRAGQERPRPGLARVPRSPGTQVRGLMAVLQRGCASGTAKLRWCAAWAQWNRSHSSLVRKPNRTWGATGPGETS